MTTKKIKASTQLRKAWKLIEDGRHWTRGTYARDKNGHECEADDVQAVRFCALGALEHVAGLGPWSELLQRAAADGPIYVNDHCGHAAVRKMYAKAIKLAVADERKAARK